MRKAQLGDKQAIAEAQTMLKEEKIKAREERKKPTAVHKHTRPDGTEVTTRINYRTQTITFTEKSKRKGKA